ncbi:hypothetical protein ACFW95_29860 [Streptomyces sp. NPDC059474]|uniref:hypothetical protein n=1 Tax=Streptomyces sp. NPDC059474 TaxID=3346846 RepID=UPI00369D249E
MTQQRQREFTPSDQAFLAALLHRLPREMLRELHRVVRPDTVLRWQRDFLILRDLHG